MTTNFALDLRVARKNSGLTQEDCAHLLGVSDTTMAKLEGGTRIPTIPEICTLSLIYGRSFESLFGHIFDEARSALDERLNSIPQSKGNLGSCLNRQSTLNRLSRRLTEEMNREL